MYRVLMPIDGSESRGAAQAETVIALPDATESITVILLYVFDDEDEMETTTPEEIAGGNVAANRLRDAGVAVEQTSRVGDPAIKILAAADEVGADHIVLGGRKRSPVGAVLFGSVSQNVIVDADRPVTITGGMT
ncbi:universal stress protein [Halapricum desulfuricans]|uniref:Nucleotide-binding protein, UspA family n=1 Tax=Halapricum desulfuricans TaxID=2841257 RepID=A0A897NGV4_9EURY|nr:universal stress protein [Halapricum desulfuricans]QSG08731.1 Nucleotide-binding protein, UspA family [Halapricum desulfuricans]QSG11674.1 Nucleotide-binding protein, UspA family [Halapricum desulfuricans]